MGFNSVFKVLNPLLSGTQLGRKTRTGYTQYMGSFTLKKRRILG